MTDKDALLRECRVLAAVWLALWDNRSAAINQNSFRFPSGAAPTQKQIDDTMTMQKKTKELFDRITAALEDDGWIPVPQGVGRYWLSYQGDLRIVEVFTHPAHESFAINGPLTGLGWREFIHVAEMSGAKWNGPLPLPPLPKG